MSGFLFPATAALMLREHTYMSDIAITLWLRNYGASGDIFYIKSVKSGNHHYRVVPVPGGFKITPCKMSGPTA